MTIDTLNELCKNTMVSNLGMEFTSFDGTTLTATMPVDNRTMQPMGYLHGGASLALAETLASAGSIVLVNDTSFAVFGTSVSAQHVKSIQSGTVKGIAKILHKGRLTHCWEVRIYDDDDNLISSCQVTNTIIKKDS